MIQPLRDFPFVREAYNNGETKGLAKGLFRALKIRGFALSPEVQARISACQDPESLDRWLEHAENAASLDEIFG